MRLQSLTRLLSLTRQQAGSLVEIQRRAATQAVTAEDRKRYQQKINVYHKERVAWKAQMTELRKKWLQELQQAQEADRRAAEQLQEEEKAQHASSSHSEDGAEYDGQLKQLMRELEDAQLAYEVAVDRLKRAERETLRTKILQEHESRRFEDLVEDSKRWITPDTLDAKISEILDAPASLDAPPVPAEGSQGS